MFVCSIFAMSWILCVGARACDLRLDFSFQHFRFLLCMLTNISLSYINFSNIVPQKRQKNSNLTSNIYILEFITRTFLKIKD